MLLPLVSVHSNHSSIAMGVKGRSEPPFAVSLWLTSTDRATIAPLHVFDPGAPAGLAVSREL